MTHLQGLSFKKWVDIFLQRTSASRPMFVVKYVKLQDLPHRQSPPPISKLSVEPLSALLSIPLFWGNASYRTACLLLCLQCESNQPASLASAEFPGRWGYSSCATKIFRVWSPCWKVPLLPLLSSSARSCAITIPWPSHKIRAFRSLWGRNCRCVWARQGGSCRYWK